MESSDLLEVVEASVSSRGVREEGERGTTDPGEDGDDQDTDEDSTLDAEEQADGDDDKAKETHPSGGTLHVGANALATGVLDTSGKGNEGSRVTTNQANTSRGLHTDETEVKTNTSTSSNLDTLGNETGEPLTNTEQGQENEQNTLDEDGCKSGLIGDVLGTVEADDSVGKVGVQAHTGSETNGQIGEQAHQQSGEAGNGSGGGDHVQLQYGQAVSVAGVGQACRVGSVVAVVAHTRSARVGDDE